MTIIDINDLARRKRTQEFKLNMNNILDFCKAALDVLGSKDISIVPTNDTGMKKLEKLLETCKKFKGNDK